MRLYTAESQALAILEILVQDELLRARYVVIPAHIPDDLTIEQVRIDQLPLDWRSPGARGGCKNSVRPGCNGVSALY